MNCLNYHPMHILLQQLIIQSKGFSCHVSWCLTIANSTILNWHIQYELHFIVVVLFPLNCLYNPVRYIFSIVPYSDHIIKIVHRMKFFCFIVNKNLTIQVNMFDSMYATTWCQTSIVWILFPCPVFILIYVCIPKLKTPPLHNIMTSPTSKHLSTKRPRHSMAK